MTWQIQVGVIFLRVNITTLLLYATLLYEVAVLFRVGKVKMCKGKVLPLLLKSHILEIYESIISECII